MKIKPKHFTWVAVPAEKQVDLQARPDVIPSISPNLVCSAGCEREVGAGDTRSGVPAFWLRLEQPAH